MNDLMMFQFETNEVRSIVIDGEPWFVGKDIAVALRYSEPHKAIVRHVDEADGMKYPIRYSDQTREMYIINESGLFSLILSSKLPKAKEFKHWVTSEVLPAIRKTGTYTNPQAEKATYNNPQRLCDVVELAKLTVQLMENAKHHPADISQAVGEELRQFGISMPDVFYGGVSVYRTNLAEDIPASVEVVASFLSEFGSVMEKTVGEVYNAYLDYCNRTGNIPIRTTYAFGAEIVKQTGIHTKSRRQNGKAVRVYTK